MSNLKSEQIKSDYSIVEDFDQPLNFSQMTNKLNEILGKENCFFEKVDNKKLFCYKHGNKIEVLLLAAITYMGGNGQHPIFKKRMQLKKWYKDIVNYYEGNNVYNVRFIGMYHYDNNIVLVEFLKETYLKKKMNSSAAHVYTNDFNQAMQKGVFHRTDRNNNELNTVKYIKFKEYLNGTLNQSDELFDIFDDFNNKLETNVWISSSDAIPEMHDAGWNKWKEVEWPGWYLEFKLSSYIKEFSLEHKIKYVGSSHKQKGQLDFDLWFDSENFYGDLKASDISKNETPGNDKLSTLDCINRYGKMWYIIYEHDTIKDDQKEFEATKFRTHYIKDLNEWPKKKVFDELSYHKRMKHSIRFMNMFILEINRINFRKVLSDFNQGRQQDGSLRNVKLKISKRNIDNFIVFQERFKEI